MVNTLAIGLMNNELRRDAPTTDVTCNNLKSNESLLFLGDFPADWNVASLSDLTVQITDGTHITPKYTDNGVPFLRVTDIKNRQINWNSVKYISREEHEILSRRCRPENGDLLLSKNGTIGIPYLIDFNKGFSIFVSICLIKVRKSTIDTLYLYHTLTSDIAFSQYKFRIKKGTVMNLHLEEIRALKIPVPSLEEQRKIAAILSSVDASIGETEAVIAKLNHVKNRLFHDLLTRGFDERGILRDLKSGHEQFRNIPFLGQIPNAWNAPSIGSIAIHIGSGVTPKGGSKVYKKEGILFIRSQNVTFDGLLLDDIAYIDINMHMKMKRSEIFSNDVLLNITGASIGRCCPVPEGIPPANVNQHVCAIRLPNPSREDAILLSSILASPIGQSQIERFNAGGNREGLNYEQLRSFIIPWPPLEERKRIAQFITFQNSRLCIEGAYLNKLKQIKKGLMHDLLTGKVRVKVDNHA